MRIRFNLIKFTCVFLILIGLLSTSFAQTAQTALKSPRQEKLLNGLRILMWSEPSADKVTVKLRIHSGSAFDPQGRDGVMSLLTANIFPNDASRDYFNEDLGGSLDLAVNYDYIQINASAKPENILPLLETLGRAITAPAIDKETTAKLKAAQLEKLKGIENNPEYIADQAASKRLFGTFPYGRPILGTNDSIAKIDYADLLLAKQRFLTSDNATIAISGNFKPDDVYRALRRYFGGWEKADKLVPPAFRQPDAPETQALVIKSTVDGNSQLRFLTRGIARNDKNFAASEILMEILRHRLLGITPANGNNPVTLRQEAHFLPGVIILSQRTNQPGSTQLLNDNVMETILAKNINVDEFNNARALVPNVKSPQDPVEWRLDVDTYALSSLEDDIHSYQKASIDDVESLRQKIAKQPVAIVIINSGIWH